MDSAQIEQITGEAVVRVQALHGGCIGEVYRVQLANNQSIVAKVASGKSGTLDIEGYMLRYLVENSRLPVPEVIYSSDALLLMSFIEGGSRLGLHEQQHAAELLADLHSISAEQFGLERDTLIGPLHQPNPRTDKWLPFFTEQRLLYMGRTALDAGRLPRNIMIRLEAFCSKLDQWIQEPEQPSLVHGDLWTTNILAQAGRITGFIDPAIYYGHPEMDLAYSTLFGTFGSAFFDVYDELRPIPPGFFEERRDIYNLYPLLVHVRLFGGGYVASVDRILNQFGF